MTEQADAIEPTFCTVVDLNYLPRTLALYRSLEQTCPEFKLHILCMEAGVEPLLERLTARHAELHDIAKLEDLDPELAAVKLSRTGVEYCWTVKATLCRYLLESEPGLDVVTYVDSDLLFFDDPRIVLAELGEDSIMILPHRFPPRWAEWGVSDGIFNGAWLTFRRDGRALDALSWWRGRCLEWCHDRREEGKYADQHYLDDWPERFEGVRVIAHPGAGLAPWNACRHRLDRRGGAPRVDGAPAIFYHYQSLRLVRAPRGLRWLLLRLPGYRLMRDPAAVLWWTAPDYELGDDEIQLFWIPYLRRLLSASAELRGADPGYEPRVSQIEVSELGLAVARRVLPPALRRGLRRIQRRIQGRDL